jgi:hypothetical protein
MATTNIFGAVLGRHAIKWDAFWHLFEWLLDKREGHGLGDCIRIRLLEYTFGQTFTECIVKREYPISGQTNGKGKWADLALGIPTLKDPKYLIVMDDIPSASSGGRRKLDNLNQYVELSRACSPNAIIRAVAVTDAPPGTKLSSAVYSLLKDEAEDYTISIGWKLLHLQTIGTWVQTAMVDRDEGLSDKMRMVLGEFIEWSEGLGGTNKSLA